ncbi:copper transporter [Asanoa sp. WMMD1127]|uniref:copper transporter n=1 Tax=Asanoa sp. WMMD1127 TaxID=3016107 RepID=UPI002417FDB6|nr:copper transporter [Asanoa sp. WMMD1127]MDG4824545.1 copper transporter [Asanoa sp. WMMD1127]
MINFRYHVVSLTAVFLALAIGLVVGTAALNGPVADSLNQRVSELRKDNTQLRDSVSSLQEEVKREEDFATEMAQVALPGRLTGRKILMVTLPTGRDQADQVRTMLTTAGATITGRIDMQDSFFDPNNAEELLYLAASAAQPNIPTTGLPSNSDGVETASALLASAVLDRTQGVAPPAAELTALLTAYEKAKYLGYADAGKDKVTEPAQAVVIVSGLPYVDKDSAQKDQAVVTMVSQFDKQGAVVVAGNGASDGNVVAAIRSDGALVKSISTVDNANTPQGQLVAALATAEMVNQGKAGQYGLGAGAASMMPQQPQ